MRTVAVLLLLALLALAAPTQAQPPQYSEPYVVRAGMGDIPTVEGTEPAARWNLHQTFSFTFTNSTQRDVTFLVQVGATVVNATCACDANPTVTSSAVTFHLLPTTPSGAYTARVLTSQAVGFSWSLDLVAPEAGPGVAVLYVPRDATVEAAIEPTQTLPSTAGTATIVEFRAASFPDPFWATIHPGSTAVRDPGATSGGQALNPWLLLGLGLVLGAILWAVLVSRGVVQRKGRKQVAATAAHVEAAAAEPVPVLEGRKRALLAALKEIEVARMANEMPVEVYDAVKADLKKQAVTVMRALETAQAAGTSATNA